MVTKSAWLLAGERTCWALGLAGLVWWGAYQLRVTTADLAREDVQRFAALKATPDQSLWSPKRVSAWRQAMSDPAPAPLAVLRIPKIRLEVAVLPGTDDRTLDRGVGYIEGTAPPGTDGNLGIAGHRDGFFRGLKDLATGDLIQLDTLQGMDAYRIERMWVVKPEEVFGARPHPHAGDHSGHLFSVLLRRLRPRAVHRPCRAGRRQHQFCLCFCVLIIFLCRMLSSLVLLVAYFSRWS